VTQGGKPHENAADIAARDVARRLCGLPGAVGLLSPGSRRILSNRMNNRMNKRMNKRVNTRDRIMQAQRTYEDKADVKRIACVWQGAAS
jgi:hypothetical protein